MLAGLLACWLSKHRSKPLWETKPCRKPESKFVPYTCSYTRTCVLQLRLSLYIYLVGLITNYVTKICLQCFFPFSVGTRVLVHIYTSNVVMCQKKPETNQVLGDCRAAISRQRVNWVLPWQSEKQQCRRRRRRGRRSRSSCSIAI